MVEKQTAYELHTMKSFGIEMARKGDKTLGPEDMVILVEMNRKGPIVIYPVTGVDENAKSSCDIRARLIERINQNIGDDNSPQRCIPIDEQTALQMLLITPFYSEFDIYIGSSNPDKMNAIAKAAVAAKRMLAEAAEEEDKDE